MKALPSAEETPWPWPPLCSALRTLELFAFVFAGTGHSPESWSTCTGAQARLSLLLLNDLFYRPMSHFDSLLSRFHRCILRKRTEE
jgi:hypothetical protein